MESSALWFNASITELLRLYIIGSPSVMRRKTTVPTKRMPSTISYSIVSEIILTSYWKELGRT
jgi:hypothetical protein